MIESLILLFSQNELLDFGWTGFIFTSEMELSFFAPGRIDDKMLLNSSFLGCK